MNTINICWVAVKAVLPHAVSICWDECHKIYINMDEREHRRAIKHGYKPIRIGHVDEALATLKQWYGASCDLRFINSVSDADGVSTFQDLIHQFAEEAI